MFHQAPVRIRRDVPDAKIVLIFCEPIRRILSDISLEIRKYRHGKDNKGGIGTIRSHNSS